MVPSEGCGQGPGGYRPEWAQHSWSGASVDQLYRRIGRPHLLKQKKKRRGGGESAKITTVDRSFVSCYIHYLRT